MQVMHTICSSVYVSKVTNCLTAVPHRIFPLAFHQTFWRLSDQNLHALLIQYWSKCDKKVRQENQNTLPCLQMRFLKKFFV